MLLYKCEHGEADGATSATCASSRGDGTCLLLSHPSQGTELCTGLETPGAHPGLSAVLCPAALHKHCTSGLSICLCSLAWNLAGFRVPEVPCRAQSQARYFGVRPSLPPSSHRSRLFQSWFVPQLPPALAVPWPGPGWGVSILASPSSPGACPAFSPPGPGSWRQPGGSRAVSPAGSLQGRAIPIRHDVSCVSLEDIHLPYMVTAGRMVQALSMCCSWCLCCHQCHQLRVWGLSVCAGCW